MTATSAKKWLAVLRMIALSVAVVLAVILLFLSRALMLLWLKLAFVTAAILFGSFALSGHTIKRRMVIGWAVVAGTPLGTIGFVRDDFKPTLFGAEGNLAPLTGVLPRSNISLQRASCGVLQIAADEEADVWFGQGMAHATDRGMQMLLMRIVGQGRVSEILDASDESLHMDRFFRRETGAFIDFYHNFDRVLLAERSIWFDGRCRSEVFSQAATRALTSPPKQWGEAQQFRMTNIFFKGKLPRCLGFDRGPFTAMGGRATIHQAQLYSSHGRQTSFLPSFRLVTDLGEDEVHTSLAGGPSDRRFSRYYASDVKRWLNGHYKTLSITRGSPAQPQ